MRPIFLVTVFLFATVSTAHARMFPVVDEPTAKKECSDCHMAYPPVLLAKSSWEKIFANLSNHFGEDATLDAATAKVISDYYIKNSNDVIKMEMEKAFKDLKAAKRKKGKSVKFLKKPPILLTANTWASASNAERIQDLEYFKKRHHFSPRCKPVFEAVMKREHIKTLAMCSGCHSGLPISGAASIRLKSMDNMTPAEKAAALSPEENSCLFG